MTSSRLSPPTTLQADLHWLIDDLARLEPGAFASIHLLAYRVWQAVTQRPIAERTRGAKQWSGA
jgi:hypothetical protein